MSPPERVHGSILPRPIRSRISLAIRHYSMKVGIFAISAPHRRKWRWRRSEPKAEVHIVGKINGLTIYDVFYRFQREGAIDWKSILVRAGPSRYREIYHDEPNEGKANSSFLVKIGEETVLGVQDNQYRMDEISEFWCFGADGPQLLDFKPIWSAAREVTPADQFIMERPPGDLPKLVMLLPTLFRGSAGPCCEIRGVVKVRFSMQQCRITVTGTDFVASDRR